MPINLNSGDQKLLGGCAIVLVCALAVVAYMEEDDEVEATFPSTYSVRSGGAKATYTLLERLGYRVERWSRSPGELPSNAAATTLIIASPQRNADTSERKAIRDFVGAGGTLLVTGMTASMVIDQFGISPSPPVKLELSWKSFPALTPGPMARIAHEITMPNRGQWRSTGDQLVPLYGRDDQVNAVQLNVGKGKIFWLSSSVPLSNSGLKAPGNVDFLVAVLQTTATQRVLWDTYFTETERKSSETLLTPATRWGALQLLLVMVCVMWTFSRRLGPTRPLPVISRLSPVEFVEALGNLYQKRRAANLAVEVAFNRFRFALASRLGLQPNTDLRRLADRGAALGSADAGEIEQLLQECDGARFDTELRVEKALYLAQRLRDHARRMRLVKPK
jgi:hypothetical protein